MATEPKDRLLIDVEPELRQRLEHAASVNNVSTQDYVVQILKRVTFQDDPEDNVGTWGQLSARSFARDWGSEEDAVYDSLA